MIPIALCRDWLPYELQRPGHTPGNLQPMSLCFHGKICSGFQTTKLQTGLQNINDISEGDWITGLREQEEVLG